MKVQRLPQTIKRRTNHQPTPISHPETAPLVPPLLPDPQRWLALAALLAACFLGVLDFFIVNVSIPAIQESLGASFAEIQLVIAGYGLTYAVVLITGGRLGDLYGRKRLFLIGVGGFTVASAFCGLAPTPAMLIASRALQGITGAVMFPQVLSIVQVSFPVSERARAFSILGMVSGVASCAGLVLGGLLVEANLFGLGWRPIFLVNLPVGIVALVAASRLVRESRSPRAARNDPIGVALASVGLFLLIYPLIQGREAGWPWWMFGMLAGSATVLPLFLWHERRLSARGGTPLVELALFRDWTFVTGLLATSVFYVGLSAFFLTFTLFLQDGLKLSPREAGLTCAPFAVGFLISSTLAVKLATRLGRRAIQMGAGLMAASLLTLIALTRVYGADLPSLGLVPLLLVYGAGQGFVIPALLTTVLSSVPSHAAGSASGLVSTGQQVALAIGVAAIGSVFFTTLGPDAHPEAGGFVGAISVSLLCNVGVLAATIGLVYLLPRHVAGHAPVVVAEF